MLRIKTMVGKDRVYTLMYVSGNQWITLYTIHGKSESYLAPSLQEAASNHLTACQHVKDSHER